MAKLAICPTVITTRSINGLLKDGGPGQESGDQGGVTEGIFELWWKGDILYARNGAVNDSYLFAWSKFPEEVMETPICGHTAARERALIWSANYHPDGGQIFYPMDLQSEGFKTPLALPGDDVSPESSWHFFVTVGRAFTSIPTSGTER